MTRPPSHTRRRFTAAGGLALAGAVVPQGLALPARATAPAKPLRILILGGTGFIGPDQVRYALSRGHAVTLFNRGRQPREWPAPVEELLGDRSTGDLRSLDGREWDVCIDNPTTLPFWVRDAGQVLHGKVGHYVFISTISVYAGDDRPGSDETAPTQTFDGDPLAQRTAGPELYGPMKAASEKEAERQFPGMTTIIRPGLIVGPGDATDRFTYWPVRLARGGEIAAPGDGTDPVQFIDARDLAEWTIRMAEQRLAGVYNAVGPARPLTTRAMLAGIGKAVHSTGSLTWIPTAFLDAEKIQAWSDMPVWVPGQGETAGFARRDIRRALTAGLTFRPLAATAADTLAWFQTLPADRQAKLKAGLTPERERALLAHWKAGRAAG